MNQQQMQQLQPPAEKRQRLLTSAANAANPLALLAMNEPVGVACEEAVPEQNQRLPKQRSVGGICQMCLHPLSKTGHLQHTDCSSRSSTFLSLLSNQSCMRALDCERSAPYGYASCGPVLGNEYTAEGQEKRLKIDLTRLRDDAAAVTNPPPPPSLLEQSSCMKANVVIRHYISCNVG